MCSAFSVSGNKWYDIFDVYFDVVDSAGADSRPSNNNVSADRAHYADQKDLRHMSSTRELVMLFRVFMLTLNEI